MTVCAFCISVRAFVEHVADSPEASPEDRLRDQAVGPLERFVFSPCHFDYHALHHAHASIPHYRLPRAKQELIGACGRYPHAVGPGYLRSLARHLQRLPLAAHDDGR
jgi:fatty acid desaturase